MSYVPFKNGQTYAFMGYETRKLIDLTGGSSNDQTPIISQTGQWNNNQIWKVVYTDGGYFNLVNVASGTVMDLRYSSKENGTGIQGYHNHGGANQQWSAAAAWGGTDTPVWYLINRASQTMVCIKDGNRTNQTQLVGWDINPSNNFTDPQGPYVRWIAIPATPNVVPFNL